MAWSLYGVPVARPRLPWEMRIFAPLPGLPTMVLAEAPVFAPAGPLEPAAAEGTAEAAEPASGREQVASSMRVKSSCPPLAADAAAKDKAFQKWVEIAKELKPEIGKKGSVYAYISETIEPKATGTLMTRACSISMYLAWCRKEGCRPYHQGKRTRWAT